jgi:hypothetical protein
MCGRYRLSRRKQIVEEYFESASDEEEWSPRYNIAPTQRRGWEWRWRNACEECLVMPVVVFGGPSTSSLLRFPKQRLRSG